MWPLALKSPLAGQAEMHCGPHKGGWVLWEQRKTLSKAIFVWPGQLWQKTQYCGFMWDILSYQGLSAGH